jgi:hypothetical protein
MRTTVELPDNLLEQARQRAQETGVSLKEFFVSAVAQRLAVPNNMRYDPPVVDGPADMPLVTREEMDEAMFG